MRIAAARQLQILGVLFPQSFKIPFLPSPLLRDSRLLSASAPSMDARPLVLSMLHACTALTGPTENPHPIGMASSSMSSKQCQEWNLTAALPLSDTTRASDLSCRPIRMPFHVHSGGVLLGLRRVDCSIHGPEPWNTHCRKVVGVEQLDNHNMPACHPKTRA